MIVGRESGDVRLQSRLGDSQSERVGADGREAQNAFVTDVGGLCHYFPLSVDASLNLMFGYTFSFLENVFLNHHTIDVDSLRQRNLDGLLIGDSCERITIEELFRSLCIGEEIGAVGLTNHASGFLQ